MTETQLRVDVVIFGGGIAGLWLLNRLRAQGYAVLLLESGTLGGGQTLHSQGIIHGGAKYTLGGEASDASEAVAAMPARWRACLAGEGEIDLRAVPLLSPYQYLWSSAGLVSRVAGFFAGKLMRARVAPLDLAQRPTVFRDPGFDGAVYRLDEPVVDVPGLVGALVSGHEACIISYDGPQDLRWERNLDGGLAQLQVRAAGRQLIISARRYVLAAGAGNEALLRDLGHTQPAMQRRPLHMVMVKGILPAGLYAHCLGGSATPRVTITSHPTQDGETVWYLGGELAESGVQRERAAQIAFARTELMALLPWVDVSRLRWSSFFIDRAEPAQPDGKRPATRFCQQRDSVMVIWPTKLVLAPQLADDVLATLQQDGVLPESPPGDSQPVVPRDWPRPAIGQPPWERETAWD